MRGCMIINITWALGNLGRLPLISRSFKILIPRRDFSYWDVHNLTLKYPTLASPKLETQINTTIEKTHLGMYSVCIGMYSKQ